MAQPAAIPAGNHSEHFASSPRLSCPWGTTERRASLGGVTRRQPQPPAPFNLGPRKRFRLSGCGLWNRFQFLETGKPGEFVVRSEDLCAGVRAGRSAAGVMGQGLRRWRSACGRLRCAAHTEGCAAELTPRPCGALRSNMLRQVRRRSALKRATPRCCAARRHPRSPWPMPPAAQVALGLLDERARCRFAKAWVGGARCVVK
jgi:hypothetical protein